MLISMLPIILEPDPAQQRQPPPYQSLQHCLQQIYPQCKRQNLQIRRALAESKGRQLLLQMMSLTPEV